MSASYIDSRKLHFWHKSKSEFEILDLKLKISETLKNLPKVKISLLNDLQGDLKDLSEQNAFKLLYRILKYDFKYPVYVWFDKKKVAWVLDGNQRNRVISKFLGESVELPYIEVFAKDKNQAKKEILAISSDYGEVTKDGWDNFIGDLDQLDFDDIKDEFTFDKWFDVDIENLEAQEDDFNAPPIDEVKTDIVLGDLFEIGEHRLLCGNSTDSDQVAKLMNGQKADMVFTDPPYNVNYANKNEFLNNADKGNRIQTGIENDNFKTDDEIGEKLWYPSFLNLYVFAKDDCSIYMTMPQGGTHMMMMMMMMNKAGWQVKHELIWLKNNHVLGRTDYFYKHEPIVFGWKEKHSFYGKGEFNKSVWEIDKPTKSDLHPTMKPIKLIENCLLNSTKTNDLCTDFFLGSGSTMVAAHQLNRKCYGMELDTKYCDVIVQRIIKLDNTLKIKRNGIDETDAWLSKINNN